MLTVEFTGNERFEILAEIGGGGMGTVYRAFDHEAETHVALKVLRTYSPEALVRFKREFRALAGLHHPNLILLGDLAEVDGCWFFTMELLEGVDFRTYTTRPTPSPGAARYDDARLRSTVIQVTHGLSALHRADKVHCDIKPSNVLVTGTGRTVVLDFGLISEADGPDPLSGPHVAGTITYMAPEQLEHRSASPASDFYALGTMIYEVLTGVLPFEGNLAELVVKKYQSDPTLPSERAAGIPPDLDQLCLELLARRPGDRPSAEDILRRLGATPEPSRGAPGRGDGREDAVFVGRQVELDTLLEASRPDNHPYTMIVQAPSGVGKTALIREFIRRIASHALVLEGQCYERENVPFKGVDGVVDSLARHLLELSDDQVATILPDSAALLIYPFPALRRVEALRLADVWHSASVQDRRERVFNALRQLCGRLAEQRPVVIVIDDMQWAGGDTWMLLRHLMQPSRAPPGAPPGAPKLLLVLLTRPQDDEPEDPPMDRSTDSGFDLSRSTGGDRRSLARHLARLPGLVQTIELDVLTSDEAETLTCELLRRHGDSAADASHSSRQVVTTISGQLARESGGHPLFIRELVHHVSESGAAATRQNRLEDALIARIRRLEPRSRALVELIAVAGVPIEQAIMARVAELDFIEYSRAVVPLRQARLIHTPGARPGDPIEPYHDRVRQAVMAYLPPDERARLHQRLARVFEARGLFERHPELAVYHLPAADQPERAVPYAERAAQRARDALAFDHAAELYQTALALQSLVTPGDAETTLRLSLARAQALVDCGRNAEAAELYVRTAALARDRSDDPATVLDCERRAAEQLLFSGQLIEGTRALERVLAQIDEKLAPTPRRALASLLWQRARLRLRSLRFTETDEDRLPEPERMRLEVYRTVTLGLALVDNIRGADFQSRHLRLALALGEPNRLVHALSLETFFLASQMARRGRRLAALASDLADRTGAPLSRAYALLARFAVHYFMDNDWSAGLECLVESERLLREHTESAGFQTDTLRIFRCFCYMQQGDLIRLSRRVPDYIQEGERRGDRYIQVTLRSRLILPWLLADDPDGAQRELDLAFEEWISWADTYSVQHFYGLHSLCEIALYRDQPDIAANALAEQMKPLRRAFLLRMPIVRAEVDYARARVALAQARHERERSARAARVAQARTMANRLGNNPVPLARGLCLVVRAAIAALDHDRRRALADLERAITAFDDLGQVLMSHAARFHHATLSIDAQDDADDDTPKARLASARAWFEEQGAVAPETLCRMLVAGFSSAPATDVTARLPE